MLSDSQRQADHGGGAFLVEHVESGDEFGAEFRLRLPFPALRSGRADACALPASGVECAGEAEVKDIHLAAITDLGGTGEAAVELLRFCEEGKDGLEGLAGFVGRGPSGECCGFRFTFFLE